MDKLVEQVVHEFVSYDENQVNRIFEDLLEGKAPTHVSHGLVQRLIVEAVRNGIPVDDLRAKLLQHGAKFTDLFLEAYEKNESKVSDALRSIGYRYPALTEVEWKLSGLMESNEYQRIKAPLVEMTFKSIPVGKLHSESFNFTCTKDELLELQSVVKEAENMLAKLANK